MPVTRPDPEKLAAVLKNVSPAVARFVVREIEVNRRRGHDEPIYDMVLSTVRGVIRDSGEKLERVRTPRRLFCAQFEEYLVDRTLERPQRGRIDRASILPIWDWLVGGWGPDDLSDVVDRLEVEIKRDNEDGIAALTAELCDGASRAIRKGIAAVQGDKNEQRRLAVRLGGARILKDAVQIQRVLANSPSLARLRAAVAPATVIGGEEDLDRVSRLLRGAIAEIGHHPELPIGLVVGRLSRPLDIARVVVHSVGSHDGMRILATPYAAAIDLLVYDMGLLGLEVIDCVKKGRGVAPTLYWLARIHEYSSELVAEVDIGLRSEWGKGLLETRNSVSAVLHEEIARVPLSLKELYRRRPNFAEKANLRDPDPNAVFDAMHGLVLMAGCRPYLDQLSLNQVISATDSEVRRYLGVVADALLGDVRATQGAARACALAWFETVVQFTHVALGEKDARLLSRSAEVAARAVAS